MPPGKRRQRSAGEGSVYQRKDGLWRAVVQAGTNPKTGKPKRYTVSGRDRNDVLVRLSRLRLKLATADGRPETSDEPLRPYLERWLDDLVRPSVAPATHRSYALCVNT